MGDIQDRMSSLTFHDQALGRFLKEKGAGGLANIISKDERLRRFLFGLEVDRPWEKTLLLIRGIWTAFGVDRNMNWEVWKGGMLEQHVHDRRPKQIIDRFCTCP